MKSLPHVTEIIKAAGLMPPMWNEEAFEAKRDLGTEVHRLCQKRKAPPGPAGDYARSFLRWLDESGSSIIRSEFPVRSDRFVGRCDLQFFWNRQAWIADIKTGPPHRWHGVQLAAYQSGLQVMASTSRRGVLWLSPSRAKLYCEPPIISPGDFAAWEAALTLFYWKNGR
jgi:hypothetical protein